MGRSKKTSICLIVVSSLLLLEKLYIASGFLISTLTVFSGFSTNEAGAIGIIGGADGPTAIYTAVGFPLLQYALLHILFFIAEVCVLIFVLVKSIRAVRGKE